MLGFEKKLKTFRDKGTKHKENYMERLNSKNKNIFHTMLKANLKVKMIFFTKLIICTQNKNIKFY